MQTLTGRENTVLDYLWISAPYHSSDECYYITRKRRVLNITIAYYHIASQHNIYSQNLIVHFTSTPNIPLLCSNLI